MGLDNAYGVGSLKPGICTSTTRPSSPYVGQTIFETDTNRLRVYLSTGWSDSFAFVDTRIQYVIVGGGGGGSGGNPGVFGSGGNSGQVLYGLTNFVVSTNYTVTVGSGGNAGAYGSSGGTGNQSSAFGLTAFGGSGGVFTVSGANGTGASGSGRNGIGTLITGSEVRLGGGGGGASTNATSLTVDGGGRGGFSSDSAGISGTANTGGGGGGSYNQSAVGAGGSGVIYLRYNSAFSVTVGAGLTASTSTVGSDKVTTFTAGTGTISFS